MRYLLAFGALLLSLTACAQESSSKPAYEAGKHYVEIEQPVRTSVPDKIEVVEVFSYHCGGCFSFEPALQAWKKQQPDDVVVLQSHAIWNKPMRTMAQAFYTTKALKIDEEAHMGIFNAIHLENKRFNSPEQWATFLANYGSDKEDRKSVV